MRRSSSASRADRSRVCFAGSRPRARSASSRRILDTGSFDRVIGTACTRESLLRKLPCLCSGSGPSGVSWRGILGARGRVRSLSVNRCSKDLDRFSWCSFISFFFSRAVGRELSIHEQHELRTWLCNSLEWTFACIPVRGDVVSKENGNKEQNLRRCEVMIRRRRRDRRFRSWSKVRRERSGSDQRHKKMGIK
jgi:hypothetical protein